LEFAQLSSLANVIEIKSLVDSDFAIGYLDQYLLAQRFDQSLKETRGLQQEILSKRKKNLR